MGKENETIDVEAEVIASKTQGGVKEVTIDVGDIKDNKKEKVKVNLQSDKDLKDFIDKDTKRYIETEEEKGGEKPNRPVEQLAEEIKSEENKQHFTESDFREIAKIIIDIVDIGVSSILRLWAGDNSFQAYGLPKDRVERLEYQMTLLLVKWQTKFRLEFLILITLCMAYYVPFTKAKQIRKLNKIKDKVKTGSKLDKSEEKELINLTGASEKDIDKRISEIRTNTSSNTTRKRGGIEK